MSHNDACVYHLQNKIKQDFPPEQVVNEDGQEGLDPKHQKGFFSRLINKFQSLSKNKLEGEEVGGTSGVDVPAEVEKLDEQEAEGKRIANIRKGRWKGKKNSHLHRKGD